MRAPRTTPVRLLTGIAASALLLAGCGGATVNDAASSTAGSQPAGSSGASTECGAVNLALNDWVGYTANAAVYTYVAESKLGCTVEQTALKEELAWQGFASGTVDIVIENWSHEDLVAKYITTDKVAVDAGPTGNEGQIGWYVPPWMAEKYPDITDYNNLNKYADQFVTSESGGKGQLLDGDPSFVTNDEALVKNLGLNYTVVYAGSEAALITGFKAAEANKTPMLGYFYSPQWFLAEVPLVRVNLPPYTDGCDSDPEAVACDYASLKLNKIMSKSFADSGSPAVSLLEKFQWTNDDQNLVAKYITDGMTPEEAAEKWVTDNAAKVDAWLA